ncbi:STAS domain-containing protein [Hydrogenophaga sp.]|uniref:STAS domain-containing protein n=1 Tax=Hydrogenophaga sp. TaxID=1904254 RepID=UPI0025C4B2AE|nr:STAS domain-containing protein [Hydrogenophaga sp.]MBT9465571.1 STAS domain-containing protein [Hydrogenophaga sp.]
MSQYTLTLTLPERLTLAETTLILARLDRETALHPRAGVVLNAASLNVFDSSALALLLAVRRGQITRGKVLRVSGWPSRLNQLATLYGVRDLLAI